MHVCVVNKYYALRVRRRERQPNMTVTNDELRREKEETSNRMQPD